MLLDVNVDVNEREVTTGASALQIASAKGDDQLVKLLLEKGAQLDVQRYDGYTALMDACECGSIENVKLLLDKGANVDVMKWVIIQVLYQ